MTKIVLDAESFKALASDTRLHILKALDARPLTVSELSRLLDLNKATVFEHLKQLTVAELVKREDDPARKWVYYKLTWKGRNVLHPENAQIFIMLGLGALGVGGALLQTARLLQLHFGQGSSSELGAAPTADQQDASMERQDAPQAASDGSPTPAQKAGSSTQEQLAAGPGGEPEPGNSDSMFDAIQSADFLIITGIVCFLVLLTLLVRALYVEQRRERGKIRALIDQLPADVNAAEERGV